MALMQLQHNHTSVNILQFLNTECTIVMVLLTSARLAQSVEHETLNLRVVGSSPTLGDLVFLFFLTIKVCV